LSWHDMAQNGTLSTNQGKALAALLVNSTIKEAAKAAGLGERTVKRYLADDTFRGELRKRQQEALAAASAAMAGKAGDAVKVLYDMMMNAEASDNVRVRAALGFVQRCDTMADFDELAERLDVVEEGQKTRGNGWHATQ